MDPTLGVLVFFAAMILGVTTIACVFAKTPEARRPRLIFLCVQIVFFGALGGTYFLAGMAALKTLGTIGLCILAFLCVGGVQITKK